MNLSTPNRSRVFLDGFNLALDQGTGVATYARNLSFAMERLGFQVGVLYGTRAAPSRNPLIREVAFFDERVGVSPLPQWVRDLVQSTHMPRALLVPESAVQVPITGQVIVNTFRDRLPYFDEIWNAENLFNRAHTYHSLFGKLLNVKLTQRGPEPRRRPAELMHWTYPLPVRLTGARNIYTMHDLVPLRLPYTTLDIKNRYLKLHRSLVRTADHIVAVSEASKRDIINLLGVPEERVTNTYQAVHIPRKLTDMPMSVVKDEVHGSFGLTAGKYWLFFGAIEPKKNIGRMIQAFLASGVDGPLVIVGKKAWKSEQELQLLFADHIRSLVQEGPILRRKSKIVILDYAPFRLLVNLIRGAKGVLFPSLYEGFGLPALEAMLLGTPVITSNTASMPEVVGDAAITVDPYDISAMVQAIQALDRDADLRGRLSEAGPRRADLFSAERYAERLGALYSRLGVTPPDMTGQMAERV
jgi:glycosyltransferase involved in cell wall biosynthesis